MSFEQEERDYASHGGGGRGVQSRDASWHGRGAKEICWEGRAREPGHVAGGKQEKILAGTGTERRRGSVCGHR